MVQKAFIGFALILVWCVILYLCLGKYDDAGPRRVKSRYGSTTLKDKHRKGKLHYQGSSRVGLESITDTIQVRKNMRIEQCDQLDRNRSEFQTREKLRLKNVIVNDKYKVLYCFIPKVACTNLLRIFLLLTGKINMTDPVKIKPGEVHGFLRGHLTFLHTLSAEKIQHRLKQYRKVIFVREPLVRLLSAYRNKFTEGGNKHITRLHGTRVIKLFRENPSQKSLEEGHDVKFSEFVDYILYLNAHSREFNQHWDTYFNLCSPCHIHYDFIGKLETLEEDVDLLLTEMGADQLVIFPKREESYKRNKTEDILENFYRLIDPKKTTKLQDIYRLDYGIFGYQMPQTTKKLISALK